MPWSFRVCCSLFGWRVDGSNKYSMNFNVGLLHTKLVESFGLLCMKLVWCCDGVFVQIWLLCAMCSIDFPFPKLLGWLKMCVCVQACTCMRRKAWIGSDIIFAIGHTTLDLYILSKRISLPGYNRLRMDQSLCLFVPLLIHSTYRISLNSLCGYY